MMNNEYYYKITNARNSSSQIKMQFIDIEKGKSPIKSKNSSGSNDRPALSPPNSSTPSTLTPHSPTPPPPPPPPPFPSSLPSRNNCQFEYQRVESETENQSENLSVIKDKVNGKVIKESLENSQENINGIKIIDDSDSESANKLHLNLSFEKISLKSNHMNSENNMNLSQNVEYGAWHLIKKTKPLKVHQKSQQLQSHQSHQYQQNKPKLPQQQLQQPMNSKNKNSEENIEKNQKIKKRDSFLPKVFTIVPLDKITNDKSRLSTTGATTMKFVKENGLDRDENFKLPTIVLKSYENSSQNQKNFVNSPSSRRRSTSSILKNTFPTPAPLGSPHSLPRPQATSTPTINTTNSTILPPPPEFARRESKKLKIKETLSQIRQDTEESITNTDSQVGNSTSPESILDQILSAASSLSVRSSSLSSGPPEMPPQLVFESSKTHKQSTFNGFHNLSKNSNALETFNSLNQEMEKTSTLSTMSSATSASTTRMNNGVTKMNGNNNNISHSLTPKSPEIIISQPPLLQTTSPSLSFASLKQTLLLPRMNALETYETNSNRSRCSSPSQSVLIRVTQDSSHFPDELKCKLCSNVLNDPRTLFCLHSFCFECLLDENFKQDSSIPFWSHPGAEEAAQNLKSEVSNKSNYSLRSSTAEMSLPSDSEANTSPSKQRGSSFSLMRKKSFEKILLKGKLNGKSSPNSSTSRSNVTFEEKPKMITCKICNYGTEIPIGGLRQLPQNYLLVRKIEDFKLKNNDEIISRAWCTLCMEESNATYHCATCTLNLCTLCKESHERQRSTATHSIRNILEMRKSRRQKQSVVEDKSKFSLKCGMHPSFELKSFCTTCLQVACPDCLVLLHKGHKFDPVPKAINYYTKLLRDSTDQTRPLCTYAEHSIEKMNDIAKNINRKCDEIQEEVESFMNRYYEALDIHSKTLLTQINRARESKVEMILEQQLDLEKRTNEALDAISFSQELCDCASDVEILAFLNILLKRFDYCQQFKTPPDPKISDSLHFLPKIRAPSTKSQSDIPLFGIITMQIVEPSLCTLQWEGFSQLRIHKKVELTMLSRDSDNVPLCHGGLSVTGIVKYKEVNTKFLPVEISDNRDGTYIISFIPDSQGSIILTVTINDKHIKGSPFTFLVRSVRPHTGTYHCCAFCSSKGSKMMTCSCEGRMPGFNGCGHGHVGHPGRRHWSCCGNVLENSECSVANKLLNS